jgi:hypothetical protein
MDHIAVKISAFAALSVYGRTGKRLALQIRIDEIQTYN